MRAKSEILLRRSKTRALKLSIVISRHHNLKIAFNHLHSQIRAGLLEAEDVFASLAMPLMKLVDIKNAEMEEEGRVTAILNMHSISNSQNVFGSGIAMDSSASEEQTDASYKEESFANKVNMAGKELVQQQKHQLLQLVHTLEQIKFEVTSSQDGILQTLADRKQSFQRFFQKVVNYIQVIHQSREDNDNFLFTAKVLKAIFNNVGVTLCSVEDGVEELINNLAEKIYNPMVKYVHGVKEEMSTGTCPRLLSIVAEMEREMRVGRLQLEESKSKVKELEKSRLQFLHLLEGSEEGLMKAKDHTGNAVGDGKSLYRHGMPQKVIGIPPDGKADDKLLWEMLKNKRKYQLTSSPQGPSDLLGIGTSNKQLKSTNLSTRTIVHKPHQPMIPLVPLGSSPSATVQEEVRQITSLFRSDTRSGRTQSGRILQTFI